MMTTTMMTKKHKFNNSKLIGSNYEIYFKAACAMHEINVYRLPDFGSKFSKVKIINTRIICDFILAYNSQLLLVDTKTISSKKLSFSTINKKSFKNQIVEMMKLQVNIDKPLCGFVVHFSTLDTTVFFNPGQLFRVEQSESLSVDDGLLLKRENEIYPNLQLLFDL